MPSVLKLDTIKSLAGNEAISINESGIASFSNIPMLFVYRSSGAGSQTITNNTTTKVQFDTVGIDTHSWWDAVNYRYTPQIPGYYRFDFAIGHNGTTITQTITDLYKNGGLLFRGYRILGISATTTAGIGGSSSRIDYMNGTTDYVEVFGLVNASSGTAFFGSSASTFLQAQLIQRTA
jgi:hypothetical protein